jgi:hypothetical protein
MEHELARVGKQLKKKVVSPLASVYRSELDASQEELDENQWSYYFAN